MDRPGTHKIPLGTRVVQLTHELAFATDPTYRIDRDELAAICTRYTAMETALTRVLHELDQVRSQ